ncbi:hypothetical protein PF008_g11849 [Phytophthora fragariae]|uniref:DDE-1 domain-containing protein n=1 Tax=Phytophthora fragariae TaxID=53985 RepID=A0A6G0RPP1_9STRA|nr:hypothetical protein PF008_g11849 [Phytophthora fragariae]
MRRNKVRAVTTRCLLVVSIKLEPHTLEGRSEAAAIQYLCRSRKRNWLSIRRNTHKGCRKRSEVQIVADEFGHSMRYELESCSGVQGYEKYEDPFNMVQTSIYGDMHPKTTITFQVDRDVDVGQGISENSFRACVFLCASTTGVKLPPFIVFAGVHGCKVEAEVHMNILHKAEKVWKPSVTFCRVLLLDSFKVHKLSPWTTTSMGWASIVVPGGTNSTSVMVSSS